MTTLDDRGAALRPMSDAPRNGDLIKAFGPAGEDLVCWQESRTCMLGLFPGAAPGAGSRGPGWVSANAEYLPVDDDFIGWLPAGDQESPT